jgi:hypothetical protein
MKVEQEDKDTLALVQVGRSPTHYVVQIGDQQLDVGGGRNNILHTLLLFLHTVKGDRGGMVGRVQYSLLRNIVILLKLALIIDVKCGVFFTDNEFHEKTKCELVRCLYFDLFDKEGPGELRLTRDEKKLLSRMERFHRLSHTE